MTRRGGMSRSGSKAERRGNDCDKKLWGDTDGGTGTLAKGVGRGRRGLLERIAWGDKTCKGNFGETSVRLGRGKMVSETVPKGGWTQKDLRGRIRGGPSFGRTFQGKKRWRLWTAWGGKLRSRGGRVARGKCYRFCTPPANRMRS